MNKNPSNEQQLESLSALLDNHWYDDDEIASDVLVNLQKQSASNQQLRQKFERYNLIRDVMHNEVSSVDLTGFSDRVSAAIANEPAIVSPAGMSRSSQGVGTSENYVESTALPQSASGVASLDKAREIKAEKESHNSGGFWSGRVGAGVGGFAVAASVAMVALLGYNLFEQQNPDGFSGGNEVATNTVQAPGSEANLATLAQNGEAQTVLPVGGQQALDQLQNATAGNANIQFVSNTSTYWVKEGDENQARNPALEKRLNQFLGQHIENSPTSGRLGGMVPYSRLAGYDTTSPGNDANTQADQ